MFISFASLSNICGNVSTFISFRLNEKLDAVWTLTATWTLTARRHLPGRNRLKMSWSFDQKLDPEAVSGAVGAEAVSGTVGEDRWRGLVP